MQKFSPVGTGHQPKPNHPKSAKFIPVRLVQVGHDFSSQRIAVPSYPARHSNFILIGLGCWRRKSYRTREVFKLLLLAGMTSLADYHRSQSN